MERRRRDEEKGGATHRLLRGGGSRLLGDLDDSGNEVLRERHRKREGQLERGGKDRERKKEGEAKLTCCVRAPFAEFSASTTLETFLFCFPGGVKAEGGQLGSRKTKGSAER